MSFDSESQPIRVCPACGSEFQPHVLECLDCGAATVSAFEGEASGIVAAGAGRQPNEPPDAYADRAADGDRAGFDVELRTGDVAWLKPLLARFDREGIESRIVPHPQRRGTPALTVLIRPGDEERARKIDLQVYRKQVPDLPGALNRGTTDACPACGAKIRATTTECPDCGLAIWEEPTE